VVPAAALPVAVERAHGGRLPLAVLNEPGARELTTLYDLLARKLITTEATTA